MHTQKKEIHRERERGGGEINGNPWFVDGSEDGENEITENQRVAMTTINTANDHTRPPILIASPFPKLSIFFKHKVTHGDWSTLISNFFKTVKSNSFSLPEKLGRGPTKSKIVSIAGLLSNKFLFLK